MLRTWRGGVNSAVRLRMAGVMGQWSAAENAKNVSLVRAALYFGSNHL